MTDRIMVRTGAIAIALLATTLTSTRDAGAQEFQLRGREVAIYNLAGTIEVVRGSGSAVVVEVTRGGSDAARLEIEVGEVRGREALRVIYPSDDIIYEVGDWRGETTLRVRSDGTFGDGGRGGERVRVRNSGRGLEAHADLRVTVPAGRDVSLHLAVGDARVEDVEGDFSLDLGAGEIYVQGLVGSVNLDTGSGSVEVHDVQGDVLVDTGSGSVRVSGVKGDRFMVDTGSGRVEAENIDAATVNIDTGSGSVEVMALRAPSILIDTGSGSVRVDIVDDVDRLEVDTGSGSITVAMSESVGAEIELESSSGGIDVDLPVKVRRAERNSLTGEIGDGRGVIHLDTGSGGIRILRRR